jgi:adenosylcobyric acid synthase
MAEAVSRLAASGTPMIGICGGYQMMGANINDPSGVESDRASVRGLGLMGVETRFAAEKKTEQTAAEVTADRGLLRGAKGLRFDGYEIHMGDTWPAAIRGVDAVRPAVLAGKASASGAQRVIGYASDDGWVLGTYTHGMFADTRLRRLVLSNVARRNGVELQFDEDTFSQSQEFDKLADLARSSLDMGRIGAMLGL